MRNMKKRSAFLGLVLVFSILGSLGLMSALPDGGNHHCDYSFSGASECYIGGYGSSAAYAGYSVGCFSGGVCGTHYYVGYVDHSGGDYLCYNGNSCPSCGDSYCNGGESCSSCSSDCGACPYAYYYQDLDADNYGNASVSLYRTSKPAGYSSSSTDCNDNNSAVNPGKTEICDTIDNDCDTQIDEGLDCTMINMTYWANLNGQNISSAGINDSVFMMAPGMGFDGKFINYTIYKRGSLTTWNPLNWFTHTILQTSSLGISDWLVEDTGSYFFKVKIEGVENESGNLDVAGHINTIPQTSIILSPTTNYAAVNYSINFSHSSSDEDDMLNLFWDFGDGENYTYYNYSFLSYGSGGAGHSYDAAGIYTVRLTASEKGRNQGATATKTIYVLQPGINAVPVITSPNESQVYENRVGSNASQSFVANCTHGPMAGAFVVGDLNCSYIHAPGKRSIIENYDLKLNWTIRDNNNGVSFSRYGTWKNNYTSAVEYWWYFEDEGERTALLIMNYSAP
jgi:PKD repeat protein